MITGKLITEDDVIHENAIGVIHPISMVLETEHPFILFEMQVFHTLQSLEKGSKPILSKQYKIIDDVMDKVLEQEFNTFKEMSNMFLNTFYNMILTSDNTFKEWIIYSSETIVE